MQNSKRKFHSFVMRGAAVMLMTKPKKQEEEMEKGAAHVNLNDL